ncbi:MAG: ATP-binding cassette domain-containing protein [Candidatus Roizmanbacteria bacterium]
MLIKVKNLCKYYQVHKKEPGFASSVKSFFHRTYFDAKAVDDISFTINQGELIGFIGPNGAGKTTTLKCLSGLLYPTHGEVSVLGFSPSKREYDYLRQIALVMGQKNQLWWDLPAYDSFLLNQVIYGISDHQFHETVNELMELLDLNEVSKIPVRKLSLGQRMKCELVTALLHRPKVLFLDEPTIGLDVVMQKNIRDFIKMYNQKYNATIMLTSHYMEDVKELCDRVIIIDHGKLLFDGRLDDIVKKYTSHKVLSMSFDRLPERLTLEEFGSVLEYEQHLVRISVQREKTSYVVGKLLETYQIDDLNIEEVKIEEIIREVFNKE